MSQSDTLTITWDSVPASTELNICLLGGTGITSNDSITWVSTDAAGVTTTQTFVGPIDFNNNPDYTPSGTAPFNVTATISVKDGYFTEFSLGNESYTNAASRNAVRSVVASDTGYYTTNWGCGRNPTTGRAGLYTIYKFCKDCTGVASVPTQIPSSVTDMRHVFDGATAFNQDIGGWFTSSITGFQKMFLNATSFNQSLNDWDMSSATGLNYMFNGATSFNNGTNYDNYKICFWNVSSVGAFEYMFKGATSFNLPLGNWDVSDGYTFEEMFNGATSFQQSIINWNVSSSASVTNMFSGATGMDNMWSNSIGTFPGYAATPTISTYFGHTATDNLAICFENVPPSTECGALIGQGYDPTTDKLWWNGSESNMSSTSNNVIYTTDSAAGPYDGKYRLTLVLMSQTTFSSSSSSNSFQLKLNDSGFANYCKTIVASDNSLNTKWGVGGTNRISFQQLMSNPALPYQIPRMVNTQRALFRWNKSTGYNGTHIINWDVSNVTNTEAAFSADSGIGEAPFNQDISSWDVSNVTDMDNMFNNNRVFNQSIGSWDVSQVTDMTAMFQSANVFNQNIRMWDTSNVTTPPGFTNYSNMFRDADAMIATWSGTTGFGNATNFYTPTAAFFNQTPPIPCFLEGTQIETDKGLVPIQDLRKGDLVKTFQNGYKAIEHIGVRPIEHKAVNSRAKDQLYVCKRANFPEATEDLVITGCHSLLIDREFYDDTERDNVIQVNGNTYVTDGMWRFPACVLKDSVDVYEHPGMYIIYHFALENEDHYMNYGVYANGILVETSSIRYMRELSNMYLIGENAFVFADFNTDKTEEAQKNIQNKTPNMVSV